MAAVLSPTPGTPGRLSDGSPRNDANTGYDRGATPVRCYRVRKRRHDEEYQQLAVLQPSADGAVHVVALDCPSGIEGLSWEWD